jgi:tetratricopeptide (TPR) repeat protein
MPVFISYSSADRAAVEKLVHALAARGIECWWDQWHIGPGDDIVARINTGLEQAGAGVIVFSRNSRESRWVEAEASYFTYARIHENKLLIPVVLDHDSWVPPLLRPLARRGIEETEAIADALLHRRPGPPPAIQPERGRVERLVISLSEPPAGGVAVEVKAGDHVYGALSLDALPPALLAGRDTFLRGVGEGARAPAAVVRIEMEQNLAALGEQLRSLCLPGDAAEALAALADGSPAGTTVEVAFEASSSRLLALPFEALRLPGGRPLATHPSVVILRRPAGLARPDIAPFAGPLKILVAVGAPEEGQAHGAVLDSERELGIILDSVSFAQRHENAEVRILEVGHPDAIGDALDRDAYHALHISCHGLPGKLELEDEDGRAVSVTAAELLEPIRRSGRPVPLVFLNSCHGGVEAANAASFAEALLRAGVPCVVAMQTSVSDVYATRLAGEFYENLARREVPLAGRALAEARRTLEQERLAAAGRGEPVPPEYATSGLFVAGREEPLVDYALDRKPLATRPVHQVAGPVPHLGRDDLIGRRREVREALGALRDPAGPFAGVAFTGMGGVGKSAAAGRAIQRLAEDGWLIPAHAGRFDLTAIALAVGAALFATDRPEARRQAKDLVDPNLDPRLRFQLLQQVLSAEKLALVLDDFEQNLTPGGEAFLDADVPGYLRGLAAAARSGRLLLTCRYPVPGMAGALAHIPIGPLSTAETRKLLLRLPALAESEAREKTAILRLVGGHPRMLEFLDALLRGGRGRLPHVTAKLEKLAAERVPGFDPRAFEAAGLEEGIRAVLLLGARDVFLEELLVLARAEGHEEALLQLACSNLPVSAVGLARMLANPKPSRDQRERSKPLSTEDAAGNATAAARAIGRLEALSLVYRSDEGAWVHRWTAQGLAVLADPAAHCERSNRAGRYRMWRLANETHGLEDAVEAVRNFLAGGDFDSAAQCALDCIDALRRLRQSVQIAALASEVLETLPETHASFTLIADEEATAHLVLGQTGRALARYEAMLSSHQELARAEPERADYQRDLSACYDRVGDLYRDLGQGGQARTAYESSLAIIERLARAEPDRADYQCGLSVSYIKVGDVYSDLGQGEQARTAYESSLSIRERLAHGEPDRADYQRGLSVSYIRVGDVYSDLGQGEQARAAYQSSLAIAERLARAEPDNADYQYNLSVSFDRVGNVYRVVRQAEQARAAYESSLTIIERLARAEPDRADYQSDLSVSYIRVGDLCRTLGRGEQARAAYESSLAIAERLARAEPDRADYQRALSLSYSRLGDLYRDLGQGEQAREYYLKDLPIIERLARAEPDRADYQRDLSISYNKVGNLYRDLGQGEQARTAYQSSLAILESLKAAGALLPTDEPYLQQLREKVRGQGA